MEQDSRHVTLFTQQAMLVEMLRLIIYFTLLLWGTSALRTQIKDVNQRVNAVSVRLDKVASPTVDAPKK